MKNPIVRTIVAGIMTMVFCVLLLTASACIPRSMIRKNAQASAEYFAEREGFPVLIGNYVNSMQDNFSDTVLCNVLYCMDSRRPFTSAVRAAYADGERESAAESFLAVVEGREEANAEYGRYWHGTAVVLRPLLMILPIRWIRVLFGTAATAIQLALVLMLTRRKQGYFAACYSLALLWMAPWMFFTSLEYSTAFLAASVAELAVMLRREGETSWMPFFAAVGVITCFVDFLTTETMTFTLPMLLILVSPPGKDAGRRRATDAIRMLVQNGLCWLAGYAGMFALKILLLFLVSGGNTVVASLSEGFFRMGGAVYSANIDIAPTVNFWGRISGAIWHNLACLYPITMGRLESVQAWLPTAILLIAGMAAVYLLQDGIEGALFLPMGLLALIPYLRYIVLSNHSYVHFFYTYRAQMVSATVFLYFIWENALRPLVKRKR